MLITNYDYLATNVKTLAELPGGQLGALQFLFTGTNLSGQTVTRANLGTVEIMLGNKEIDRVDLDKVWGVVDKLYVRDYGKQRFVSTDNSTIAIQCIRPLHLPGDKINNLAIKDGELKLKFTHSSLAAVVASLDCAIYYRPRLGINSYFLRMRNFSQASKTLNAAPDNFNFQNVGLLHLDYSASLTQFIFRKDNRDLVNAPNLATLQYYRALYNGVRDGDAYADADSIFNGIDFDFANGNPDHAMGSKFEILMAASSALTFNGLVGTIHPNKDAEMRSMANYNDRVAINVAQK